MSSIQNVTHTEEAQEGTVAEIPMTETMINHSDYKNWSVQEIVNWCIISLTITEDHVLIKNIRNNEITGDILTELSFDDCKELCNNSLHDTIKFKISINQLKDTLNIDDENETRLLQQEENMTVVLKNIYTTLSQKLQDYSTQYSKLRLDILDAVKAKPSNTGANISELYEVQNNHYNNNSIQQNLSRSNSNSYNHNNNQTPRISMAYSPTSHTFQQAQLKSQNQSSMSINTQHHPTSPSRVLPKLKSSSNVGHASSSTNEPLKQLRASKEDSCEKILKNAMKRHHLSDQDWRQYLLVICYGDQERALELNEKPVTIFKNLRQQGLHPSIMLRRRGDFEELQVNNNSNKNGTNSNQNSNGHQFEGMSLISGGFNATSPIDYSGTPGGRL